MSLGTGAKKGWWGVLHKYEAQQGGFHGDPVSRNQPCQRPPTSMMMIIMIMMIIIINFLSPKNLKTAAIPSAFNAFYCYHFLLLILFIGHNVEPKLFL